MKKLIKHIMIVGMAAACLLTGACSSETTTEETASEDTVEEEVSTAPAEAGNYIIFGTRVLNEEYVASYQEQGYNLINGVIIDGYYKNYEDAGITYTFTLNEDGTGSWLLDLGDGNPYEEYFTYGNGQMYFTSSNQESEEEFGATYGLYDYDETRQLLTIYMDVSGMIFNGGTGLANYYADVFAKEGSSYANKAKAGQTTVY